MRDFRDNKQGKFEFKYRKSDPSKVKERASQSGGKYDQLFKEGIPVFSTKPGKNYDIRILPPGWDNAEGYNFELWVHYNVGPDNQRYVCLQKMKDEPCPCCEEVVNFQRDGDTKLADQLKAKKRQVPYIVDRDHAGDGPQIWPAAWTTDKAIAAICIDERSGEIIYLDDPDQGFDLQFKCEKKGESFTEIIGIKTARNPSPISDDPKEMRRWLRFITENPIPDCIQYYSYDHIKKVLEGGKVREDDSDEDDKPNRGITRSERQARDAGRTPADRERLEKAKRKHLDDSVDKTRDELDEDNDDDALDGLDEPAKRNGKRRDVMEDEDVPPRRSHAFKSDESDEDEVEPVSRRKVSQRSSDDEDESEETPMRRRR